MGHAGAFGVGGARGFVFRAAVLALAALISQVLGCGLFDTRESRPGGGPGVNCLTPNAPDDVVFNVLAQYASSPGLTCYVSMLDSSFTFHPDAADSIDALGDPGVFLNWTRDVETRVTSSLASDATFHLVFFDSLYATTVISPDGRTQLRFYAYHLNIHAPDADPDTLFQGRADITLFQGSDAQWHITNWQDRRDGSGERTWGYLRRLYRGGGF